MKMAKNNDRVWNNELWLCIKTTPNKIVHFSAIFTLKQELKQCIIAHCNGLDTSYEFC